MSKLRCILFVFLSLGMSHGVAGNEAGNGAGGWLCKDGVELLDLWEASIPGIVSPDGLNIQRSNKPYMEQILAAIGRLSIQNPTMANKLRELYSRIFTDENDPRKIPVFGVDRDRVRLSFPHDAYNSFQKPDCKPVGLAIWDDETGEMGAVSLDETLFDKLISETDRAALWMHEMIYKSFRVDTEKALRGKRKLKPVEDSRVVRLVVGYLFSDLEPSNYPFLPERLVSPRYFPQNPEIFLSQHLNENMEDRRFKLRVTNTSGPSDLCDSDMTIFIGMGEYGNSEWSETKTPKIGEWTHWALPNTRELDFLVRLEHNMFGAIFAGVNKDPALRSLLFDTKCGFKVEYGTDNYMYEKNVERAAIGGVVDYLFDLAPSSFYNFDVRKYLFH